MDANWNPPSTAPALHRPGMASHDRLEYPDEEAPLLQGKAKTTTPIPWGQISPAFLVLISESISSEFMTPFLNKFIGETGITGGDDRKIGYYSSLMESVIFVAQIFTTWQWSRLSDFIGRRPVLLFGVFSVGISRFSIGLSRTFSMLVLSRCIGGMLDGGFPVVLCIIGDLTDNTNMAQVFAAWPATVSVAMGFAALYGGALAKPQERWPHVFRGEFWATYPYFLPSFVTGCFTLFAFCICAIFLKESLASKPGKRPQAGNPGVETPEESQENMPTNDAQPVSISTLLTTTSVVIPIGTFVMMSLMDVSFSILLPLFYQSPIKTGGLGLPPYIIGSFSAVNSVVDSCIQVMFVPKLVARFGAKKVLCWTTLWAYPVVLLCPIMSAMATAQGRVGPTVYALLVAHYMCQTAVDLSFAVIFIFVTRAAPNKQSLGSVNGLNQSLTSVARVVGASSASLFAFSKQYNVMGGNFVYLVLVILATIPVVLSQRLPDLEDGDEDTEEGTYGGGFM